MRRDNKNYYLDIQKKRNEEEEKKKSTSDKLINVVFVVGQLTGTLVILLGEDHSSNTYKKANYMLLCYVVVCLFNLLFKLEKEKSIKIILNNIYDDIKINKINFYNIEYSNRLGGYFIYFNVVFNIIYIFDYSLFIINIFYTVLIMLLGYFISYNMSGPKQ